MFRKKADMAFSGDPVKLVPRLKQIHKLGDFPTGYGMEDLDAQHQSPGKVKRAAGLLGALMGPEMPMGRVPSMSEQFYASGVAGESGDGEGMPLELLMMAGPSASQGAQMAQMANRLAERKGKKFQQKAMAREVDKERVVQGLAAELAKLQMEKKSYKLQGQTEVQGIPVAVENKKGSVRRGTDRDGHKWETKMRNPYGYIKGTKGADGEEVDAFVGPDKGAKDAFVVHQRKPDGRGYDEDKVMLAFKNKAEAKAAFLKHYDDPKFLGPISKVSTERLKELVASKRRLVKISQASYVALLRELSVMEKRAVSEKWVRSKVRSALEKGVSIKRYDRFRDRMVGGNERMLDKAFDTSNAAKKRAAYRLADLYGEGLDHVQKYNPYDWKPGPKGLVPKYD